MKVYDGSELNQWLVSSGASLNSLAIVQNDTGWRGLRASRTIQPDQVLLAVPRSCLITVAMGKETTVGSTMVEKDVRCVHPNHSFLAIFLLVDMEKGSNSRFHLFYDSLPKFFDDNPVTWSPEELQALKGSWLLELIQERQNDIQSDYNTICQVDPTLKRFTLRAFTWARMVACSRTFGVVIDEMETFILVPFADMFNHGTADASYEYDNAIDSFKMVSNHSVSDDREVFISYGEKSNDRLFLNYGFTICDNTNSKGYSVNEIKPNVRIDEVAEAQKASYIKQSKFIISSNGVIDLRLCCDPEDVNTRECFSILRILVSSGEEFAKFSALYAATDWPPISLVNEVNALDQLHSILSSQVNEYPTTLNVDVELINSKTVPMYSNKLHTLYFLKGDKEVFHHFIQLTATCTASFKSLQSSDSCLKELEHTLPIDYCQQISKFIQN